VATGGIGIGIGIEAKLDPDTTRVGTEAELALAGGGAAFASSTPREVDPPSARAELVCGSLIAALAGLGRAGAWA
jgi:hypothetical protein